MFLARALFCLSLLYSVNLEPLRSLKTWYFYGNQNVSASGDEAIPQITCLGPLCTEVEIRTVKCEVISLDADNRCHSPDISREDGLKANYILRCIDNKLEQESCYVEVTIEREFSLNSTVTPVPSLKKENGVNFVNLIIAFVLSQIALYCCIAPILYFSLRPKKSSK